MNQIVINFEECDTAPSKGYNVKWRVFGSSDPYTDVGNFFTSPAVFTDGTNPDGTQYEGKITAQGRNTECNEIDWATPENPESGGSQSSGSIYAIVLTSSCAGGTPFSTFDITGFSPGDTVKVRATYAGLLQMTSGLFTRADLGISSPDGTSDLQSSTCYSDSGMHGFSITADTDIVIPGLGSTTVLTTAIIHNGSQSPTNLIVSIIEVNGIPQSGLNASGCKGNSGTGGTC